MGIKAKILKELQKKPRRLKELKAKLGNDKKVARAVDELVERNKVVCRKGVYAVPDPKTGNAVECTLVKLAGKFGFARPVQPDGQDIFIPGKYLMGAMPGDTLLVSLFEHPRVEGSSEGEVLAVVKENNRFTGTVETIEGRQALVPDACPGARPPPSKTKPPPPAARATVKRLRWRFWSAAIPTRTTGRA